MRRTILKIAVCIVIVAFALGCGKNESNQEKSAPPKTTSPRDILVPEEFFPTKVGLKWTYLITLGDVEPLRCIITYWSKFAQIMRGRFWLKAAGERLNLIIRSKATAANQGPLKYPKGVELEVLKDELGVFVRAKQVFWAISTERRFEAYLVATYDAGSFGIRSLGQEVGYSKRLLFFDDRPGTQIGLGDKDKPIDKLVFIGPDANVEGYAGQTLLRFIRSVEKVKKNGEQSESVLDRAFTEEMWYAKGKGLVRLVQKVGGKISMTWTLIKISTE